MLHDLGEEACVGSLVEHVDIVRSDEKGPAARRFDQIIGNSPALEFVLSEVERVAPTDSTVLVLGETGTGKELIARAVHNLSARCGRPFIKLNCAAIPFELLESELFGHEKGAGTQTSGEGERSASGNRRRSDPPRRHGRSKPGNEEGV